MSPLWPERLTIAVCPDRLIVAGKVIPVAPATDGPLWQGALAALPQALTQPGRARRDVTVVLSNHFVRYALLAWNRALRTADEWLALAGHHFSSVHGRAADDWSLRISASAPRAARVASAVDQALLDALAPAVGASGATLVSIQPYLMAAFNRTRRRIGRNACWLVVAEPGRLALGLIEQGAWRALRLRRADDDWQETLPEMLERESAVLGLERPCTERLVHAAMPMS